jgi:hypothetical protein
VKTLPALTAASALIAGVAHADVVLDWNALMLDAIRVDNTGPTLSSRNLAILHTAVCIADYAAAYNEVKALGSKTSTIRTAEQSQIAVFWSDFSYTATPPGHWHEIAATIARDRGLALAETARLFALISVAQADSAIVCWETKYRYNLWRPITAIRRGSEDGDDATEADPVWTHFLNSPPFPAYTSGHSTFSKSSAVVLTRFLGTDAVNFSARSDSLPGVCRHEPNLWRHPLRVRQR